MGASQGEAYVVVGAPAELADEDLLGIADGLAEVATREEVSIAGGDLVSLTGSARLGDRHRL